MVNKILYGQKNMNNINKEHYIQNNKFYNLQNKI